MALTKLSTKGQVVLPKEVRDTLGLSTGTELEVEVRDGVVLLRPIRKTTVDDILGMLPWSGPPKSLDDMEQAIAKGAREQR
ncbi:MAG: AbrB family looped-hinge helix DNA binding protein [Myxococcota bacterium]|jgi:AbrB family looped-hinge helix DNA binding protein